MCHLCDEFGDPEIGGGLYYLNPKNYARQMYKVRLPGEGFRGATSGFEIEDGQQAGPSTPDLIDAMEKGQEEYDRVKEEIIATMGLHRSGSMAIPMRDGDKVLELSTCIGLISCPCRRGVLATDERNEREYTCMGMGAGMLKWERWPENYKGGVKFLNGEEAKAWNHTMDKRGYVHILMFYGAPYLGGYCQCDYSTCPPLRHRVDFGFGMMKGHYVAILDDDLCNGCGICVQRCQFGTITSQILTGKVNIDQFKCFGCGLCETGCARGAIKLAERKNFPALAGVW